MATRFRLPEALGGGEYEPASRHGAGPQEYHFDIPGVGWLTLRPHEPLTEVKPPLPEEPPVGTFVACGADGNLLPFYRRWDEGWSRVGGGMPDSKWAEICAESQERAGRWPVRIIADPFAEPVELPWRAHVGRHTNVTVSVAGINEIGLHVLSGGRSMLPDISAEEARHIAKALWAAADQAERAS